MKRMTAFIATLVAGMALAPMAASAATITFDPSDLGGLSSLTVEEMMLFLVLSL